MNHPKKGTERVPRSFYRYKYITDLSITYEGHGGEVRLHTPDISSQGMFIHTSIVVPEGAVILVKFRLRRTNFEVRARSEVRYSLPGVGVGVEFVDISPEARQAIEEELGIEPRVSSPEA
jgi:PilZ domain-containing protein